MSSEHEFEIMGIDHVQLAMPVGGEAEAERFYSGVLGLDRVAKPAVMAARGGCWFRGPHVELHLGTESSFRPARKAHPALLIRGLDALCSKIQSAGGEVRFTDEVPGVRRCHVDDPFGNRIELIDDSTRSRAR